MYGLTKNIHNLWMVKTHSYPFNAFCKHTPYASRLWTYGTMLEAQEKKDVYKNKDVYLQQVTNEKERIKRTKLR